MPSSHFPLLLADACSRDGAARLMALFRLIAAIVSPDTFFFFDAER